MRAEVSAFGPHRRIPVGHSIGTARNSFERTRWLSINGGTTDIQYITSDQTVLRDDQASDRGPPQCGQKSKCLTSIYSSSPDVA
jgi:hypothetical protein